MNAVTNAPLTIVAPLTGKSVDQLIGELAQAGILLTNNEESLTSAAVGDRQLEGKATRVLFGQKAYSR